MCSPACEKKLQLLSAHGHARKVASLTEDPWRELEGYVRCKFGEIEKENKFLDQS